MASEASFYRVLRQEGQLAHRGHAKAPMPRPKAEHTATGPGQVWSWDITYLKGPVKGAFLYLYLVVDVFSRRIMGFAVHEEESSTRATGRRQAPGADTEAVGSGMHPADAHMRPAFSNPSCHPS
ncbi:DDE-type integrase/transposase/recombinase [Pyxidicoccus trucidator]|uniref:DDE-type integrase/transposase/recombinase n=1 Tax=Pyxidicoccus trucidator TaxID=2709662 RepID=UPI0013DA14E2|nr:DDE-type integrase/transposase/recombinase [Pyxidicoccus trucidator]